MSNTVTTILAPLDKSSPCASNESLTVDQSRFVFITLSGNNIALKV